MTRYLNRQGMELEVSLQHVVVSLSGRFYIEPKASLLGFGEAALDLGVIGRCGRPGRRDQRAHGHGEFMRANRSRDAMHSNCSESDGADRYPARMT